MGLKIVMKDGSAHKFYEIPDIKEIFIYGNYRLRVDVKREGHTKLILEGMEEQS